MQREKKYLSLITFLAVLLLLSLLAVPADNHLADTIHPQQASSTSQQNTTPQQAAFPGDTMPSEHVARPNTKTAEEKKESNKEKIKSAEVISLFEDEAEELEVSPDTPWIGKRYAVTVNRAAVKEEGFRFNPIPGVDFYALPQNYNLNEDLNSEFFSGDIVDEEGNTLGQVAFTVVNGADGIGYNARFALDTGDVYMLNHVEGGQTVVDILESNNFPACGEPEHQGHEQHAHNQLEQTADQLMADHADGVADVGGDAQGDGNGAGDGTIYVKLVVGYTPASRSQAGGTAGIQALIQNAVNVSNTVYTNSQITSRLSLVHTMEVSYNHSGNFGTDLSRLANPGDNYMDNLQTARDSYDGDMVALIIEGTSYCGMGYIGNTYGSYDYLHPYYMASVTYHGCAVGNLSFTHELGHNMGAAHNRSIAQGSGRYSYSYGHHFNGQSYRTVMAYAPGTRTAYFSNPNVTYNGHATGTTTYEDNARTLNQTMPIIANFKGERYTISGRVQHANGSAVAGHVINGGVLGTKTTDASGNYSFTNVAEGTAYTITPAPLSGYAFSPSSGSGTVSTNITRNFTTNATPSVSALSNVSVGRGTAATVDIVASDSEGQNLTYSVVVQDVQKIARTLDLANNFYQYSGGFLFNFRGSNEKYFQGNNGAQWYFILPNGELYQWTGSIEGSTLLEVFPVSYYNDPTLFFDVAAPPVEPAASSSISGARVTITPAANFAGILRVKARASDGTSSGEKIFFITVSNTAPALAAIADKTMSHTQDSILVALSASDADNDPITFTASLSNASGEAYYLDQAHDFYYGGNYYHNFRGVNEKYVKGYLGWYYILPDGKVYKFNTTIADSVFIGQVSSDYYANPAKLYDVAAPASASTSILAHRLDVAHDFSYAGYVNYRGADEKYFQGALGWYYILPDGKLFKFNSSLNDSSFVAQLTSAHYSNPNSLVNVGAPAAESIGSVSISGTTLTVNPASTYAGTLLVTVSASDGAEQDVEQFAVVVSNAAPNLTALADKTMAHTQDTLSVTLSASDADNDSITFSASLSNVSGEAYYLDRTHGFYYAGSYHHNVRGADEKYFRGYLGWYYILPDGKVYKFNTTLADSTLIGQLSRDYHLNPMLLHDIATPPTLSIATLAYRLDVVHNFSYMGYVNHRGANEKYFQGTLGWYYILPDGKLYKFNNNLNDSTFVAQLTSAYHSNPNSLVNIAAPAPEPIGSVSISGTTLTVNPSAFYAGSLLVTVTATDGIAQDVERFVVTVTNNELTLAPINNQIMPHTQNTIGVNLSAADPDGDPITLSASMVSLAAVAHSLDQVHNFRAPSNYYLNHRGANELYVNGTNGWYYLLPSGDLYQFNSTLQNSYLLGHVGIDYYNDPTLLFDVPTPVASPGTVSISGTTLTVNPANNFAGKLLVTATASDGFATVSRSFYVEVTNTAPTLAAINNQSMSHRQNTITVPITAADGDGDSLSVSVQLQSIDQVAYALDVANNFYYGGSWYQNAYGANEKFFRGNGSDWFFILPNGKVYRFVSSIAASSFLAELDSAYYANPNKLFDVVNPPSQAGTASGNATAVTVDPSATFAGTLKVTVTISDGVVSTSRSFYLSVTNNAPSLAAISDRSMTQASDSIAVPYVVSDSDGDSVTVTAVVLDSDRVAYNLDQQHNFYFAGNWYHNYRGANEKYFKGDNGANWYYILSTGAVYRFVSSIANSVKVGQVSPRFYTTPTSLFNVAQPSAKVSASVSGNNIIVNPVNSFIGSALVTVNATDGVANVSASFNVSVSAAGADVGDQNPGDGDSGEPDSDNDGVSDSEELEDGTDPYDPGSFVPNLRGPIYTLWNSFLGMVNILEMVNPNGQEKVVTISLYSIDGSLAHEQSIAVPANSQFDVIVNDLPGFVANSYGILKINFEGIIDGRVSYYRPGSNGDYDFAFGVPLSNATYGKSAVGFNTYQPSTRGQDAGNVVANWLTIVNLDSLPRNFTIDSYDSAGTIILQREVSVPAFGRLDLDGGHGFAGPSVVGQHVIRPANNGAPYIAQLIRYGGNTGPEAAPTEYSFAFPLVAMAGNGRPTVAPISRQFNEENWIEILNTLGREVPVDVQFLAEDGASLNSERIVLPAYGQVHVNASSYLAAGEFGTVAISPEVAGSVIVNSMFYYRNEGGDIATMFGTQAQEGVRQSVFGSYNLYLEMENWLRVANTSSVPVDVVVSLGNVDYTLHLVAGGSASVPLHDRATFGTSPNSYGTVVLRTTSEAAITASIVRLRSVSGHYDFGAPTLVR